MRPRTDDEILEDLKDWPVRNIYVERGAKLIEQLRQRVADLENLIDLDVFSLAESNDLLRQRVQELEELLKESYKDADEVLRPRVAELEKDCDEYHQVAMNHIHTNEKLTAERDKATQYWQIAEGRCDALEQQRDELALLVADFLSKPDVSVVLRQRDELLKALEEALPMVPCGSFSDKKLTELAEGGHLTAAMILRHRSTIASVKEK